MPCPQGPAQPCRLSVASCMELSISCLVYFSAAFCFPSTMVFSEGPCLLVMCLNRAVFLPYGLGNLKMGRPSLSFGELGNRLIRMSHDYEVQAERSGEGTAGGTSGGVVDPQVLPPGVGAQRWEGPGQEWGWEGETLCRGSSGLNLGERMVPSCTRKTPWSHSAVDAPWNVTRNSAGRGLQG